jgi:hypothetical protein
LLSQLNRVKLAKVKKVNPRKFHGNAIATLALNMAYIDFRKDTVACVVTSSTQRLTGFPQELDVLEL